MRRFLFLFIWLFIRSGVPFAQNCTATSEREWTSGWVYVGAAPVDVVTATGQQAVGYPMYVYKRKFKMKYVCCAEQAAVWVDGNYAYYVEKKYSLFPVRHLAIGLPVKGVLGELADAVFADITLADYWEDERAVNGEKLYDPLPDDKEPNGKKERLQPAPEATCGKQVRLADGTVIPWAKLERVSSGTPAQDAPEEICEGRCKDDRRRWEDEQRLADSLDTTAKGLEKALADSQANLNNAQNMLSAAKARLDAADQAVKAYQDEATKRGVDVSIFGTRYNEQLAAQTNAQRDVGKWQSEVNRLSREAAQLSNSAKDARGRANDQLKAAQRAKDAYKRCKDECLRADRSCISFWGLRGTCGDVELGPQSVDYYRESDGYRARVTLSPKGSLVPGFVSFNWRDTRGYHGIKVEEQNGTAGDVQYWVLYQNMSVLRATFDVNGKKVTVTAHDARDYSSPNGQGFDIPPGATGLDSIELDAFGKTLKWTAHGR